MGRFVLVVLTIAVASVCTVTSAAAQSPSVVIIEQHMDRASSHHVVVVENRDAVPVTAVSFQLQSHLEDGATLASYRSYDFYQAEAFQELGAATVIDGVIARGTRRSFRLPLPTSTKGTITAASAELIAFVRADRTFSGLSAEIERVFDARRQDRDALEYWLGELDTASRGRAARDVIQAMVERCSLEPSSSRVGSMAVQLRDNLRRAIADADSGKRSADESLVTLRRVLVAQYRLARVHCRPAQRQEEGGTRT
jgi:hypothetical protein